MAHSQMAGLLALVALSAIAQTRIAAQAPEQTLRAVVATYDIRELARNPGAAALVEAIVAMDGAPINRDAIQVLNGTRLVIQTSAARHKEIGELIQVYRRRLADLAVVVNARLHEVDDAFCKKLRNAKRMPLDELERLFLDGKLTDSLFKLLDKQALVQAGDEIKMPNDSDVTLLSRHNVVACLAGPEQMRKGDKGRQLVLEGVAFTAGVQVSGDRRSVRMKLTEKATAIEEIQKRKIWDPNSVPPGRQMDVEVPLLREAVHTRMLEIPDGGTILVPVHYRPASVQAKERWWVLSITPRIYIEEEERAIRGQALADVLPLVVADVLKNPRLKAMRGIYGTPEDMRFALVHSDAWPDKLAIAGYKQSPMGQQGKRMLGIRFEKYEEAAKENEPVIVTVTLVNAGGSDNGPAVGGCTLRYAARLGDKGWTVELAAP
jgi:hypothetical protein